MRVAKLVLCFSLGALCAAFGPACSKKKWPASEPARAAADAAPPAPPADILEVATAFEDPLLNELLRAYLNAQTGAEVRTTRVDEAALAHNAAERGVAGDVLVGVSRETLDVLANAGRLAPTRPAACSLVQAQHRDPQGRWVGLTISAVALGVHEGHIKEKQKPIPRAWKELTNAAYHGWVVVARPQASRASRLLISGLVRMLHPRGWDLWRRIDKNLFQYTPNEDDPARMLSAGETTFAIDFERRFYEQQGDKKPLLIRYPEPTFFDVEGMALLPGAKHAGAAARFAEWMCGDPALRVLDARRAGVTKPFFENPIPGKPRLTQLKLTTLESPLAVPKFFEEWERRYGK